jgi:hypothetical protein
VHTPVRLDQYIIAKSLIYVALENRIPGGSRTSFRQMIFEPGLLPTWRQSNRNARYRSEFTEHSGAERDSVGQEEASGIRSQPSARAVGFDSTTPTQVSRYLCYETPSTFEQLLRKTAEVAGNVGAGNRIVQSLTHLRQYIVEIIGQVLF